MITKDLFVATIDSLRINRDVISFGLPKTIIALLRTHFKPDSEGFCEIEHYCYYLDFGKCGEDYESPQKLYDRLVAGIRKQVEVKCYNPPLKITPRSKQFISDIFMSKYEPTDENVFAIIYRERSMDSDNIYTLVSGKDVEEAMWKWLGDKENSSDHFIGYVNSPISKELQEVFRTNYEHFKMLIK